MVSTTALEKFYSDVHKSVKSNVVKFLISVIIIKSTVGMKNQTKSSANDSKYYFVTAEDNSTKCFAKV